jgi:nitrite reductase/ring-hydroxylating ferredoxin subunit
MFMYGGGSAVGKDLEESRVMAEFVAVGRVDELEEGELRAFEVNANKVSVANVSGEFYAFDDVCTHRQCSLAEGELEETTVICPCHGSEFDVRSGAVLRGPAREPVETYEVRVEGENLEIRG